MSRNAIATLLAVVLAVLSVFTAWASVRYYFSFKQWEKTQPVLQAQSSSLNQTRSVIQALLNETIDYSRRHPEIRPLLEKYLLRGRATNQITQSTSP